MPEKVPRKTAVKKTPRKTVSKTVASKTVAKRVTTKRAPVAVSRKAPTPIAATVASRRRSNKLLVIGLAVFIIMLGVGAFIGLQDNGVINVKSVIDKRKESASPEERQRLDRVNQDETNNAPDGGLIPSNDQTELTPPPVTESATSTATTTDSTSTSTEENQLETSEVLSDTAGNLDTTTNESGEN